MIVACRRWTSQHYQGKDVVTTEVLYADGSVAKHNGPFPPAGVPSIEGRREANGRTYGGDWNALLGWHWDVPLTEIAAELSRLA